MTNSAPKLDNAKVHRQASPKVGYQHNHHQHNRSNSKSSPFLHKNGRHVARNAKDGRQSCSPYSPSSKNARNSPQQQQQQQSPPPQQQQQQPQQQRCEQRSPSSSPTNNFYAGAKFSETPSPASVPKPPSRWTSRLMNGCRQSDSMTEHTRQLRIVLNIQA